MDEPTHYECIYCGAIHEHTKMKTATVCNDCAEDEMREHD